MWAIYIPKFLPAPLLLLSAVYAQMNNGPLETFARGLDRHHIQVTRPALIDALQNPDKEVRVLAAAELAELKDDDALPLIIQAAHLEQDPVTQMRIAAAASWLGSREGLKMLTGICLSSKLPAFIRVEAARNVFQQGDHSCFAGLLEMMASASETGSREIALELAAQVQPKSTEESRAVLVAALDMLKNQDPQARLMASEALRWLRDPRAIAALRDAIEHENDEAVRSSMGHDLQYLLSLPPEH